MAILILTDAAADMTAAELTAQQVSCIPLSVTFGNDTYENLDTDEFYHLLTTSDIFPHTSQPSPERFCQIFEAAKERGDSVIAILLSSSLSGTYQSALLAKNMVEYDNVYLVDSLSATIGMRLLIDQAVTLRDAGHSAEAIVSALEELKSRIRILVVVDTLEYLQKGGRLSKAAANIGTLAQLKPLLTVNREGVISVLGKAIGKNRAMQALLKEYAQHKADLNYPVYPVFSQISSNCDMLLQKLTAQAPELSLKKPVNMGAAIGTHVGPGAYGIAYIEA